MEVIFCWLVGVLFTISIYLLLSSNMLRMLFGMLVLSGAVNLLIFTVGQPSHGSPAFINASKEFATAANALPQALILTAIVISFGLVTYCLILIRSAWQSMNTLNSDTMHGAEPLFKEDQI